MDNLVLLTLAVAVILVCLIVVTVILAARADHAVTISGPLATIGELQARIEGKRNTLAELEAELAKRREAIGQLADMQAEVDALTRKLDELQSEWHQLDERRREIEAVRAETVEATDELARIEAELIEKRAERERVAAELERAERLMREHEALTADHAELARQVAELRGEVAELTNLKLRADEIREEIDALTRRSAELQGRVDELVARQEQAQAEARAAQERLARLGSEVSEGEAKHAALLRAVSSLEHQRAELMAQIETLKEKAGIATGDGKSADPLSELRTLPPVLRILRKWPARAQEEEAVALQRVRTHLKGLGLHYPDRVLRAFHTAMKVNETTQMAVLAGISGTGKSQLPRRYAEAMGMGFLQVPVQPRWDSPQDLMGFYNYIESRYRPTDLARALFHLDRFNGPEDDEDLHDRMMLVLLDEMNLARVEYYFSDFLSRLESRPPRNEEERDEARKDSEIELDVPMPQGQPAPRVYPGYNLLFAGTMNEDESTQSLSDKVVDRANVLRFSAPRRLEPGNGAGHEVQIEALSYTRWRGWLRGPEALGPDGERVTEQIEKLLKIMSDLGRPFGHRLGRAMISYVANYPHDGHTPDICVPLADQVEMRLLPKLRGVETELASPGLEKLADHVEGELNDIELAEAIRDSLSHAEEGTGQFLWRGVSR
jgi:FtsZ-binding cell division protein ZapB